MPDSNGPSGGTGCDRSLAHEQLFGRGQLTKRGEALDEVGLQGLGRQAISLYRMPLSKSIISQCRARESRTSVLKRGSRSPDSSRLISEGEKDAARPSADCDRPTRSRSRTRLRPNCSCRVGAGIAGEMLPQAQAPRTAPRAASTAPMSEPQNDPIRSAKPVENQARGAASGLTASSCVHSDCRLRAVRGRAGNCIPGEFRQSQGSP